jgi:hypothetical protein
MNSPDEESLIGARTTARAAAARAEAAGLSAERLRETERVERKKGPHRTLAGTKVGTTMPPSHLAAMAELRNLGRAYHEADLRLSFSAT